MIHRPVCCNVRRDVVFLNGSAAIFSDSCAGYRALPLCRSLIYFAARVDDNARFGGTRSTPGGIVRDQEQYLDFSSDFLDRTMGNIVVRTRGFGATQYQDCFFSLSLSPTLSPYFRYFFFFFCLFFLFLRNLRLFVLVFSPFLEMGLFISSNHFDREFFLFLIHFV